jgi:translation initiation factor IF-1
MADNTKLKEEALEIEGVVVDALRGNFRVQIPNPAPDGEPLTVLAHLSGKLRKNFIKIVPGDKVRIEVSPYDITKGRITYRLS